MGMPLIGAQQEKQDVLSISGKKISANLIQVLILFNN
jgi:hypothetical protein